MKDVHSLAEWVDPKTAALVVIDVQNDFCHPQGAFAKNGLGVSLAQEMLPALRRLMEEARAAGVPVILFRVARAPETAWPAQKRFNEFNYGPQHTPVVVEGTWGAEFCEGFEAKPGDIVITKNRYDAFHGTNFDLILRNLGAQTLIMTGVATNVCVECTARTGFMLDYNIVMVDDACATTSREHHEGTLASIGGWFGRVVKTDEVIAAWTRKAVTAKA